MASKRATADVEHKPGDPAVCPLVILALVADERNALSRQHAAVRAPDEN